MEKIESPASKIKEEFEEHLKVNNIAGIRNIAEMYYPADVAEAIKDFKIKDLILILRFLPTEDSAEIFTYLDNTVQEEIIDQYTSVEIRELFDEIFTDDVVEILEELPANIVKKILKATTPESRLDINHILNYDDDTAGSIMSVDFLILNTGQTVKEAISTIQKQKDDVENVTDFFVVDELNNLKGYVDIRTLFFSDGDSSVETIMKDRVVYAYTTTDQEEVINQFKKYGLNNLPIINSENKLVGIITVDDVIEVIDEEVTEDIHKMAGIAPIEDTYFKTSVWKMVRSRIFSLLFLMLSATITQVIITVFISIYIKASPRQADDWNPNDFVTILLAPLITVLSSTSGIAGGQSSTMLVRAISLNEVQSRDFGRVMWKELRVGLICGTIVSVTNILRMIIVYAIQFEGNLDEKSYDLLFQH
ncbi:magnesium transporter [Spiroplasma clarkii]|uniref:magnesium transporter n=1 Tax=Spiroplasma clarkii TaxID=2139 RepID=UPI0011BADD98|nr:magnesium transporter [Spiroplasma clarkii]